MAIISICLGLILLYLLFTLFLFFLVHQIPRNPVSDPPGWGKCLDKKIPAVDGGYLEVWRIEPEGRSKGVVVFVHGWGRNRDRMVDRARLFGKLGFTAIIHSARDHGGSSPRKLMNALKFAEDVEAVIKWAGEPIILYGHSAGAAAAMIAASRDSSDIRLLFLEGCYAYTKEALLSIYRWYNRFFGNWFGPMILFWMDMFYKRGLDGISPARLAPKVKIPVMIIHGEKDERFPVEFALKLKESFSPNPAELFIATGSNHSDSSKVPGYGEAVKSFLDHYVT